MNRSMAMQIVVILSSVAHAEVQVDPHLPPYEKPAGERVVGRLASVNDDSLRFEMTLWAEALVKQYPAIQAEVEGTGSSTPPAALVQGTTMGAMTHLMPERYVVAFREKYGYVPTALRVGREMLAICVHRDNPLARRGLTMAQLDAIYSETRQRRHPTDIRVWRDLGLGEAWVDKPIVVHGTSPSTSSHKFFKTAALRGGDFKKAVIQQPLSSSLVAAVEKDRFAIGFVPAGYLTKDVLAVPLAEDEKGAMAAAESKSFDRYPLSRELYLYLNHKPGTPLDAAHREFLRMIYSRDGQEIVTKGGLVPIGAVDAATELKKVGIPFAPQSEP